MLIFLLLNYGITLFGWECEAAITTSGLLDNNPYLAVSGMGNLAGLFGGGIGGGFMNPYMMGGMGMMNPMMMGSMGMMNPMMGGMVNPMLGSMGMMNPMMMGGMGMMNPMMMGGMGMTNPYLMGGMMNPMLGGMGMMNPMMMGGMGMMNPMLGGMGMMNPMLGGMGMMNPMLGGMGMTNPYLMSGIGMMNPMMAGVGMMSPMVGGMMDPYMDTLGYGMGELGYGTGMGGLGVPPGYGNIMGGLGYMNPMMMGGYGLGGCIDMSFTCSILAVGMIGCNTPRISSMCPMTCGNCQASMRGMGMMGGMGGMMNPYMLGGMGMMNPMMGTYGGQYGMLEAMDGRNICPMGMTPNGYCGFPKMVCFNPQETCIGRTCCNTMGMMMGVGSPALMSGMGPLGVDASTMGGMFGRRK